MTTPSVLVMPASMKITTVMLDTAALEIVRGFRVVAVGNVAIVEVRVLTTILRGVPTASLVTAVRPHATFPTPKMLACMVDSSESSIQKHKHILKKNSAHAYIRSLQ